MHEWGEVQAAVGEKFFMQELLAFEPSERMEDGRLTLDDVERIERDYLQTVSNVMSRYVVDRSSQSL